MAVFVRQLLSSDLDELCTLMEYFAYETANKAAYNVNRERISQIAQTYCSGGANVGFLLFDGDTLIGCLLARLTMPAYSFELMAQEDYFYIRPNYRGKFLFVRLMNIFLDWAYECGAKAAFMRVESGITPERTATLLSRFGFQEQGRSFLRVL